MKKSDVITLIRLGFEPARYFKRSVWMKVERIMEYLVNRGEITKVNGAVKYGTINQQPYTESDLERWSQIYLSSPFTQHLEALKKLSKETNLPLNSKELLSNFLNIK